MSTTASWGTYLLLRARWRNPSRAEWRSRSPERNIARLIASHPVSPEVYESYLKAEDEIGQWSDDLERALPTLRRRSERILILPRLTSALPPYIQTTRTTRLPVCPPQEARPKLISAARKALELDPDLAEPHVLLGEVYQRQWQWSDAEAEYKRALELNSERRQGARTIRDVAAVPGADGRGPGVGPACPRA